MFAILVALSAAVPDTVPILAVLMSTDPDTSASLVVLVEMFVILVDIFVVLVAAVPETPVTLARFIEMSLSLEVI